MRAAIVSLILTFMSFPALAEPDWDFTGLWWDYGTFPEEEVVPVLKECLGETYSKDQWKECINLFSLPCEVSASNYDVCYAIEAKAWRVIVDDEFQQVLASFANYPSLSDQQPFESLCEAQKLWIGFSEANCRFHYERFGGSIRRTYGLRCSQREYSERAIELRQLRILPQDSGIYFTDDPDGIIRKAGKVCNLAPESSD